LAAAAGKDKVRDRERVKAKHREERAKDKPERLASGGYTLGGDDDDKAILTIM
jgi:hypothetical protein